MIIHVCIIRRLTRVSQPKGNRISFLYRLRDGLKVVLNISKFGNQYIQANKPWVLVKGNEDER